jgi:O-antigen ligase
VNVFLVLAGWLGAGALAWEMAPGRWGTILNYPGSLWRCGVLPLVYSLYLAVSAPVRRWRNLLLLAECMLLIAADGSRTALLLLPLALVVLGWAKATEPGASARLRRALAALLLAGGVGLFGVLGWAAYVAGQGESEGGLARVGLLGIYVTQYGFDGLAAADPTRIAMVLDSIDAVAEHPFLGNGIGTTKSDTDEGPMVVHMTYLQVWADLGILGISSILGLMLGPIFVARRAREALRSLAAPEERALQYNAAFLVTLFAFTALMHPLSTEWSEWLLSLVSVGLLLELAGGADGKAGSGVEARNG